MTALALVDAAAPGPFLVAGSLPPAGRDLDVLAPEPVFGSLRASLRAEGFLERRSTWARFAPLELVDLELLHDQEMLDRATRVPGCRHARRPDAADELRLTARSFSADSRLTAGRRSRAEVGPEVWAEARQRGNGAALEQLAAALAADRPPLAFARRAANRLGRVRQAGVIAVSGLDGAGKSTQAERLRDTLVATGFDVAIEWNRVSHDAWLDRVARPVKRLLRSLRGSPSDGGPRLDETETAPSTGATSGTAVPPGGRQLWVLVVALANAWSHARSVRRHTLAGRMVICDRYVLDSVVHLEAHYPAGPGRTLGVALVRTLSPTPRAAFYLALAPEVAMARKDEPWSAERVSRQARGYDAAHARLAVRRLDATRPADELAVDIAAETWRRL